MTPKGLKDRPILRLDCSDYFYVYSSLHASRLVIDQVAQPLQISEVGSYLTQFLGISSLDERVRILRVMQEMDTIYMQHQGTKNPKKAESS